MVPSPSEMPSVWKWILPFLFWTGWGLWTAIADMGNDDVQPAVLRLFIGAAILGMWRPRTWWVWALALSAWIPAEPLVASALHLTQPFKSGLAGTLLPPIPALLGGFLGRTITRSV